MPVACATSYETQITTSVTREPSTDDTVVVYCTEPIYNCNTEVQILALSETVDTVILYKGNKSQRHIGGDVTTLRVTGGTLSTINGAGAILVAEVYVPVVGLVRAYTFTLIADYGPTELRLRGTGSVTISWPCFAKVWTWHPYTQTFYTFSDDDSYSPGTGPKAYLRMSFDVCLGTVFLTDAEVAANTEWDITRVGSWQYKDPTTRDCFQFNWPNLATATPEMVHTIIPLSEPTLSQIHNQSALPVYSKDMPSASKVFIGYPNAYFEFISKPLRWIHTTYGPPTTVAHCQRGYGPLLTWEILEWAHAETDEGRMRVRINNVDLAPGAVYYVTEADYILGSVDIAVRVPDILDWDSPGHPEEINILYPPGTGVCIWGLYPQEQQYFAYYGNNGTAYLFTDAV